MDYPEEKKKDIPAHTIEKKGTASEEELMRVRKEKAIAWLKKNYTYVSYVVLAIIVWLAVRIRTLNLPRLKDVTTGTWTLGPDLDPFLFLRWTKYIVENGSLMAVDMMRYAPFGLPTTEEYLFHPYLMAWFHKVATMFGSESVTHSSVLFPAFMFGITVIAFYLLTRKLFLASLGQKSATVIALIGSFFISVFPVLLPRTIAGIPEKEASAFFFMFLALYFFLEAWTAKKQKPRIIFAILGALATTGMANIWGGYIFIFIIIAPSAFLAFLLGSTGKQELQAYGTWLLATFLLMIATRYSFLGLFRNVTTAAAAFVFVTMLVHHLAFNTNYKQKLKLYRFRNIPPRVTSAIAVILLGIVVGSVVFGPSFFPSQAGELYDSLVKPATSRLIQTVAENRQPYFSEWAGNFGPRVQIGDGANPPLTFWLFFIGSVYLFYQLLGKSVNQKERLALTLSYTYLLLAVIFSRFSSSGTFTGENTISVLFYASGFILFFAVAGYYYYNYYKKGKIQNFKKIDFGLIMTLSFLFLGIVAARGAVRTIMVLAIPVSMIIGYLVVLTALQAHKAKKGVPRVIALTVFGLVIIATLFSAHSFYNGVSSQAEAFAPSPYTQQWQYAMGWVRENVAEDAVFGHWWDYGYWVQSIGERTTILDGGNARSYWNHLMGRHALTSPNNRDALEFLYSHEATHFLIDPTDIGKYTAFSSIGSDVTYDRRSWIPTFQRDPSQAFEAKNRTVFLYRGGAVLDEDVIHITENGNQVLLPSMNAGVGAIRLEVGDDGLLLQPVGIFVYNQNQYEIPLRYAYLNGSRIDFGTGLEAGIFIMPSLNQQGGQLAIDPLGAMFYLSPRTVNAQLTRIYLYGEEGDTFKLVHSEPDAVVKSLQAQGADIPDYVYFQGFRGPIRIWEIDYPEDITVNEAYLELTYPEELFFA